jgi:hypothetical protein
VPLHDWTDLTGWYGVHQIWIVELLYWVKPRLPAGYRAYIGTTPSFAIDAPPDERPDVGVHGIARTDSSSVDTSSPTDRSSETPSEEPNEEIAVAMIESSSALHVERQGQLVAAVELVSPRNKDRPTARTAYSSAYAAYLLKRINLLLIDVHRRPLRFSFADQIASELQMNQPPCPAPFAVSYRVGEPAPNRGRFVAIRRHSLAVGETLPLVHLHLSVHESVEIDLEQTYTRASAAAYLS